MGGSSAGAYTKNNNYRTTYSYDLNGNIATLTRQGRIGTGAFTAIDNLTYSYHPDGNKLKDVSDVASSTNNARDFGYKYYLTTATGADYAYDANGNMTYDPCKALTVTYNHFNLPRRLDFGAGKIIEIT